jgi:hypothetical protein
MQHTKLVVEAPNVLRYRMSSDAIEPYTIINLFFTEALINMTKNTNLYGARNSAGEQEGE